MKVLIVVPDTNLGGITTAAVNLSNALASHGHDVSFLDMSGENECNDRLKKKVDLLQLEGKSKLWNIGAHSVKTAVRLRKLGILMLGLLKKLTIQSGDWYNFIFSMFHRNETYDVAIAFRQCAPCYSFVLNKVNAKKKMGFVHGELTYMGDISSWKKYMTSFDKIAYVSDAVKKQFITAFPELKVNACTVYNTFDVEQIKAMAGEECDTVFDKSKVNIVTVARIDNSFKQTHWIVDICEELKKETQTPFHWYVVGDGPDFDKTVALSQNRRTDDVLTFVGGKNNPYPYIRQSDFTVLTSKSEAYPMVIMESFILKRPIVVAEFATVSEMMENEKHGLIATQSIESLTECVIKMIENWNGIRERSENYLKARTHNNSIAQNQFLNAIGDKQ